MKPPIFIRSLTTQELHQLRASLRSQEAFVLKRCQILLASAQGQTVPQIAGTLGYQPNNVRQIIHAFNQHGVVVLTPQSRRPKTVQPMLDAAKREQLRQLLAQSPRNFGQAQSTWTLPLLAQVSFEQGLTARLLDADTLGVAVKRLGLKWQRAQKRICSPDPAYARKKSDAMRCSKRQPTTPSGPVAL